MQMPVTCLPVGGDGKVGKPALRQGIGKIAGVFLPVFFPFFPSSRPGLYMAS